MKVLGRIRVLALVIVFASCGPPLTQPSSVNLTGRWTSSDHLGPVFNLVLFLSQKPDGTITGTWASDVSPPHPACPPDLGITPDGTLSGTNTVVGVDISILGVGEFQGQAVGGSTLRGGILSCGRTYDVTWTLAGPLPTG